MEGFCERNSSETTLLSDIETAWAEIDTEFSIYFLKATLPTMLLAQTTLDWCFIEITKIYTKHEIIFGVNVNRCMGHGPILITVVLTILLIKYISDKTDNS